MQEEMTKEEVEYLEKLERALEDAGVPWILFSIGHGYNEESFCIEKEDSKWNFYWGERGNKFDLEQFDSVEEAVDHLILMVSESDEEEATLKALVRSKMTEEMKKEEKEYLNRLKKALLEINCQEYLIGSYGEETVCLEEDESNWIVYVGERGRKTDIKKFESLEEAGDCLISSLSESNLEEEKIKSLVRNRKK